MRRNNFKLVQFFLAFMFIIAGARSQIVSAEENSSITMYRLYNSNSGEHFYIGDGNERTSLIRIGWNDEGIGWYAPAFGDPVYRLYNSVAGDHHYTVSQQERNWLVSLGWKYEGIGWYSSTEQSQPLYRSYNPNARSGSHHYTLSTSEHQVLTTMRGWRNEGIAWYGVEKSTASPMPISPGNGNQQSTNNQLQVTIGGQTFHANFVENASSRAFREILPATVDMSELNGNEKFYQLNSPLPSNSQRVETIHAGDILLFGNNQIVLFYKTFQTTYSYTPIAKITDTSNLERTVGSGNIQVAFRIIN